MAENNNNSNNEQRNEQGENYLSKLYSSDRRPKTDYPDELAKHIVFNLLKKNRANL